MKSRTNVNNHRANDVNNNKVKHETNSYGIRERDVTIIDNAKEYDEIYTENYEVLERSPNENSKYVAKLRNSNNRNSFITDFIPKKRVKRQIKNDTRCASFNFDKDKAYISHPHLGDREDVNYSSNTYCTTVISGEYIIPY